MTNGFGLVCASWVDGWIHTVAWGHWGSARLGQGWGDTEWSCCPQEVLWHQGAWFTDFRRGWGGLPWNGFSQISWETLIQEKKPFCVLPIANVWNVHLPRLFLRSCAEHGLWKSEGKHKHLMGQTPERVSSNASPNSTLWDTSWSSKVPWLMPAAPREDQAIKEDFGFSVVSDQSWTPYTV